MGDDLGLVAWGPADGVAAEEGVVFNALLPEVLGPVARRKVKLHHVLVALLRGVVRCWYSGSLRAVLGVLWRCRWCLVSAVEMSSWHGKEGCGRGHEECGGGGGMRSVEGEGA